VSDLPQLVGEYSTLRMPEPVEEVRFDRNLVRDIESGERTIFIDLFQLLSSPEGAEPSRKLYKDPDEQSEHRTITPTSQIEPRTSQLSHGHITRIEDGFALICLIEDCWERIIEVGWIKIRDDQGKLTIWLSTPLSC
jgi:hypothetical protein